MSGHDKRHSRGRQSEQSERTVGHRTTGGSAAALLVLLAIAALLSIAACTALPVTPGVTSPSPAQSATPRPSLPGPVALEQQTASGQALAPGGWSARAVVLSFRAPTTEDATLTPEVEVAKAGQPFADTPTGKGTPIQSSTGQAQAQVSVADLAPGQYHWQARFTASSGQVSQWVAFAGSEAAFGIVPGAPAVEGFTLTGAAKSADGTLVVSQQAKPSLRWSVSVDPPAALDHFAYLADHQAQAPAAPADGSRALPADTRSLDVSDLADGQWYLHLWAVDKAGQIGPPATVEVTVARTPPRISDVVFRSWATNPLYQTVAIKFTVSRAADVGVMILAQDTSAVVRAYRLGHHAAGEEIQSPWDGKDDHGQIVALGSYAFVVDVVDDAGNETQARYNGLIITNKVIKVSLGKQSLTAYDGSRQFLTTLVTTGGQALPTPAGTFEILSKQSPFVFHSPYPKGSPYWYPDITSHQAMLFYQADADFIHDAPWRTTFGPGSNGPGVPGAAFTGSHGCVELPKDAMPKLFDWTPLGTPVIVAN